MPRRAQNRPAAPKRLSERQRNRRNRELARQNRAYVRLRELRFEGYGKTAAIKKLRSETDLATGRKYQIGNQRGRRSYDEISGSAVKKPANRRDSSLPKREDITNSSWVAGQRYLIKGTATTVMTDCETGEILYRETFDCSYSTDRHPPPTFGEMRDTIKEIAEKVIAAGGTGSDTDGCGYVESQTLDAIYDRRTYAP